MRKRERERERENEGQRGKAKEEHRTNGKRTKSTTPPPTHIIKQRDREAKQNRNTEPRGR